jgi:hypothetical protein
LSNLLTHDQIYDITQNYGWYEGSPGDWSFIWKIILTIFHQTQQIPYLIIVL